VRAKDDPLQRDRGPLTYEDAVTALRSWVGAEAVVELEPDGTVMDGRLVELDPAGIDGALFGLSQDDPERRETTGVAVALFRDGVDAVEWREGALVVRQGKMTVTVRRTDR